MAPRRSKNASKFDFLIKEINLFEKNIIDCNENISRITILKTKVSEYENNLTNIFSNLAESESDDLFEMYIKYKDILLNWVIDLEEKSQNQNEISENSPVNSSNVKLPKFEIPYFYGNTENWLSFKELFSSSILNNKSLSDIEKLQYLHTSIRGDASKLITGFTISSENLLNCWEILCNRFENKRQLAISQINKIFNMRITKANTSKSLLEMIDICNEAIRNLKTIGLETNALTDLVMINFLSLKVDEAVNYRWELTLERNKIPTLEEFKIFIEREARSLNDTKLIKPDIKKSQGKPFNIIKKSNVNNTIVKKSNVTSDINHNNCILCNQGHALFKCPAFNSMVVNNRWKVVKDNNLCTNCLRSNHLVDNCRIGFSCKNCSARHHTLLHVYSVNNADDTQPKSVVTVSNTSTHSREENNVLLSTALIKVKSKYGQQITCRALIDNASQYSLISKRCAERLNLPLKNTNHRLLGINETYVETSLHLTDFEFSSYFSSETFKVNALVVSKVTTPLPNFSFKFYKWPHISDLTLADPTFYIENEIDILLGADIFLTLITGCPILGPKGTPSALPTKLGHLLSGRMNIQMTQNSSVTCHTLLKIDHILKQFWELESVPKSIKSNDEDELCETIFAKSHSRNSEGRYILKLPFKENFSLGDSKEGALRRFYSLERKLQSDDQLKEKYVEFMDDYQNLGHMTPFTSDLKSQHYFLPHHGVINENSCTTKLRVVFDGSFKSTNGNSLNDGLLKGTKLQSDIFVTLLKFRTFPVAFTADIAKMYRQILISDEDKSFQQIFWRKSPTKTLGIFTLNTVTYGTSCAPFLAIRTLNQLCEDEKHRFPQAAKLAKDHFYVDDLLAGADSVDSAKVIIHELQSLMSAGGFELRKWSCSDPEVISKLPEALKASTFSHSFHNDSSQKILGLFWDLNEDSFQVRAVSSDKVSTKRHLLSIIARTFDPLGFVAPSTIILKIILQELWKANIDWDDQIPPEIFAKWNKFQTEIHYLKQIKIPRYIHTQNAIRCEVHGFCDASSKAYAAVIYIRIISNSSFVFLLASKTRVAPVQSVTLPRLEVSGALLLAELMDTIKKSINVIHDTYLWCDSTITLSWVNNPPTKGNQFVQHRVGKIHSLTSKESWHHIPGKLNPADWATRGLYPKQLLETPEWINGPKWLYNFDPAITSVDKLIEPPVELFPCNQSDTSTASVTFSTQITQSLEFMNKFSSYMKLIRTLAWILRFYHNTKSAPKTTGPLQALEIETSIKTIVKLLQQSEYHSEINLIQNKKSLPKSSKLISLNAFLDSEGILRVGGRLRHQQDFKYDQKHPILIPKNHHFTILIIRHFHKTNFHAGQELVLSLIRQKFWIPDGKSAVRKELRKCIDCFKFIARPISQIMGDLPTERINPCRAFEKTGIDFAGPIATKCQHSRKASTFKSYICLFICLCTKAVHLELVSTLSTAAFLASLRRFVSRRGYPSDIFSDNGTNFVGASAYLKSLFTLPRDASIQDYSSQRNIQWHFSPPYAPHFGGVWEASVKLTKHHLIKTCKAALLNFEELNTLLCQVEACINSRPLYPLSADPKDLQVLTPGHFLIGCPLLEIPESHVTNSFLSSHSRWSLLLQLKENFWRQWSTSYLHTLQSRVKWKQGQKAIEIGALVLIKDPSALSTTWTIGRVTALHPGADRIIRVVTLLTPKGTMTRPVSQLAVLPLSESDASARPPPPEDVEAS